MFVAGFEMTGDSTREASDDRLLEQARGGDLRALETLIERHQGRVYQFSRKICRDPEEARDVLQDTLLAMARGIREFRGASSLSTWLYTIARSFCIKARRRSKFALDPARSLDTDMPADDTRLVDPAPRPDEAVAGNEVEQALERAILALEIPYREVLVLRDIEGLTASEVAQVLGISSAAVKSRLHRARLAVRQQVAPLLGIPTERAAAPGNCPDVLRLFSQHLEDEISAELCTQMEQHVTACERCRGLCDSLQRTLVLCRTAAGPRIPEDVQKSVRAAVRDLLAARPEP